MISAKIKKTFQVIVQHNNADYQCCVEGKHIHHASLSLVTSAINDAGQINEIYRNLQSVDFYIEGNNLAISEILEKFYIFCQDYILIDEVSLVLGDDYELVLQYKR